MIRLLAILILTICWSGLNAQSKVFTPSQVFDFPDIHADSIAKYKVVASVVKAKSVKNLTKADEAYWLNPLWMNGEFFQTKPIGCSWYCDSGPKSLTASSEKYANDTATFDAANAHDFDMTTAWIEGDKKFGIGSTLSFDFELAQGVQVSDIIVYNGFCSNTKIWREHSRVKTMELFVNDESIGKLSLEDTYFGQKFSIGSFSGGNLGKLSITLKILEVYPGDKFKETALSEVNFGGIGGH